ncbi:immunity protein YezG family protein [Rossellomorea marisflavi]|uniref:immunity protein YezG family protein n=1 Tax=Rossellomorea marisflavi TaxID=189381 RepID=UPI00064EDE17|nr:immunity protein YezG family protein [Rossellomorea marisflavi]KMK95088.1 GNAT family acetyltransferase [Rossellomorea marisflavi]
MSFENELNELYKQIAQQVNDLIPIEWSDFYFNGEVKDKEGGVFFFFTPIDSNEPVYSHDIPDIYPIDESVHDEEMLKLFELTVKLQQIFTDNDQDPWFSVTLLLNDTGKLNIHFDYTNWHDSEFGPAARIEYFEYKYVSQKKEQLDLDLIARMKKFEEK